MIENEQDTLVSDELTAAGSSIMSISKHDERPENVEFDTFEIDAEGSFTVSPKHEDDDETIKSLKIENWSASAKVIDCKNDNPTGLNNCCSNNGRIDDSGNAVLGLSSLFTPPSAQESNESDAAPAADDDDEAGTKALPNNVELPKRARSAYNYFFRAERAKLLGISDAELEAEKLQKRKHRKTPGMIGFANLASSVGKKWKLLSEEEKQPYKDMCIADRERYHRDLEEWRKKYGTKAFLALTTANKQQQESSSSSRHPKKRNSSSSQDPCVVSSQADPIAEDPSAAVHSSTGSKSLGGSSSKRRRGTKKTRKTPKAADVTDTNGTPINDGCIPSDPTVADKAVEVDPKHPFDESSKNLESKNEASASLDDVVSQESQPAPAIVTSLLEQQGNQVEPTVDDAVLDEPTLDCAMVMKNENSTSNDGAKETQPQRRRRASRKQGNVALTTKRRRQQEDAILLVQEAKQRELIMKQQGYRNHVHEQTSDGGNNAASDLFSTGDVAPPSTVKSNASLLVGSEARVFDDPCNTLEGPSKTVSADDASAHHSRSRSTSSCSMHENSAAGNAVRLFHPQENHQVRMSVHLSRSSSPHLAQNAFSFGDDGDAYSRKYNHVSSDSKMPFFEPIEPISVRRRFSPRNARLHSHECDVVDEDRPLGQHQKQSRDCLEQERRPVRSKSQCRGWREETSTAFVVQEKQQYPQYRYLEDVPSSEERCVSTASSSSMANEVWSSSSVLPGAPSSRGSPVGVHGTLSSQMRHPSYNKYSEYHNIKNKDGGREGVHFLEAKMQHRHSAAARAAAPHDSEYLLSSEHYEMEKSIGGTAQYHHHRRISSDNGSRKGRGAPTLGGGRYYHSYDGHGGHHFSAPPRSSYPNHRHFHKRPSHQAEDKTGLAHHLHHNHNGDGSRDLPTLKEWNMLLQNLS